MAFHGDDVPMLSSLSPTPELFPSQFLFRDRVFPILQWGAVTTFEELLMTMMMAQKINKSRWMDPSNNWGQSGGYDTPTVQQTGQKQGGYG